LNDNNARKIDNETAQMIESGNVQNFRYEQACGAIGIYGLVEFANLLNYSLIRVDMYNSSLTSGDKSRVVGYGSWFLYEGEKNTFYTNHPPVFNEQGACFVTLKKDGRLRGCIGSIIAHQPLINDLVQHAKDAAFHDPRFNPVEESEVDSLTMDISLLSDPKPMSFTDEADLLNQMVPYKDGIIIKDKGYQAVYLPSVWEELPDKELFLKSLKMKAGLPPEHFSKTFEAYRFKTEYIEE